MADPTRILPPYFYEPVFPLLPLPSPVAVAKDTTIRQAGKIPGALLDHLGVSETGLGMSGKIIGRLTSELTIFILDPVKSILDGIGYTAYDMQKNALEASFSLAFWGGKKILNITPIVQKIKSNAFSALYDIATTQAEKLSLKATSLVTNKSVEDLTKKLAFEAKVDNLVGQSTISFKAIDLIGPSLLMGLCANKTLKNLNAASTSLFYLLTGKRLISHMYTTEATNCTMVAGCKAGVSKNKFTTSQKLIVDTVMQTAFASIWGIGTYFTYNGIYRAVEAASESSEQAAFITNAILTATLVAPTVLSWINEALTEQPTYRTISPKEAPHLAYIEPEDTDPFNANPKELVGKYPPQRLSGNSQILSFERAMYELNNSQNNSRAAPAA